MSLGPCRECGKEVSGEATTCPGCGAPDPYDAPDARAAAVLAIATVLWTSAAQRRAERKAATEAEVLRRQEALPDWFKRYSAGMQAGAGRIQARVEGLQARVERRLKPRE